MTTHTEINHRKTRMKIFLLALVFFLPLGLSWFLFYNPNIFSLKTMNHGLLINPPISTDNLISDHSNEKKWQIIFFHTAICDEACQKIDNQLHQVQKALGKDRERIQVLTFNKEEIVKKINERVMQHKKLFDADNKIFLVDPLGNLFMYYPETTDPMNILKDLKRVLEVSQIG